MCAFQTVHDPFFCTTISLTRSSTHYLPSTAGAPEVPRRNHGFHKHPHSSLPAQARQAGGAVLEVVAVTGYFASAMHCVREYLVDVTLCTGPSMLPALGVEGNIGNRASLSRLLSLSPSLPSRPWCALSLVASLVAISPFKPSRFSCITTVASPHSLVSLVH